MDVDDGVVRMDVSGWDSEDDAWDTIVCVAEAAGICAAAGADGDLMGYTFFLSGFYGEVC